MFKLLAALAPYRRYGVYSWQFFADYAHEKNCWYLKPLTGLLHPAKSSRRSWLPASALTQSRTTAQTLPDSKSESKPKVARRVNPCLRDQIIGIARESCGNETLIFGIAGKSRRRNRWLNTYRYILNEGSPGLLDLIGYFELRARQDLAIFRFNILSSDPESVVAGYYLVNYTLRQPVSNHRGDEDIRVHQKVHRPAR